MDRSFWEQRWAAGRIGFHRTEPHALLRRHVGRLGPPARVYVPLCGKSVDILFLRRAGHVVFGTEFVPQAVTQFFAESDLSPSTIDAPPYRRHEADGITILEGDALALTPAHLGGVVDAVYDRGSLVAVDPDAREALAASLRSVLRRQGRMLLIALAYDQSRAAGPPWSVDDASVRRLFAAHGAVTLLEEQPDSGSPGLRAAGVTDFVERAYLIEVS